MTVTSTYINLLRHGEVEGGTCYRGITDDPLNTAGWEQMHHALGGDQVDLDIIVSSPLSRCRAFAQVLSDQSKVQLITSPAFQEIDFGDWEGKTAAQINLNNKHLLSQFCINPVDHPPPNGEHFIHFQRRVLDAWRTLYQTHQGKRILLITHAGVIRVILASILGSDVKHSFRLKIAHACLSSITCFQETDSEDFLQLTQHG